MKKVVAILAVSCFATVSLADEYVTSKSPDGKFALRIIREQNQPYRQTAAIIDAGTRQVIFELDKEHPFDPEAKLIWARDSQWIAYWHHPEDGRSDSETRVFARGGSAFAEMQLPELPAAKFTETEIGAVQNSTRIKPSRWIKPGLLEIELEIINVDNGKRGALKLAIQFGLGRQAVIMKSEREPLSVVDYFLLLPKNEFEAPPLAWLDHHARIIDKQNGYISIAGDGAQPSFEVALFRYRDGKPLLAVCSGELEGKDSVDLKFFQLGDDGQMHEATPKILPLEKSDNLQFDLPRQGRTIVVRQATNGKRRFTWNGEKFVEQK